MNKSFNKVSLKFPAQIQGLNFYTTDKNLSRFLERVDPDFKKRQTDRLEQFGQFAGHDLEKHAQRNHNHFKPVLEKITDDPHKPEKRVGRIILNTEYKNCQQALYQHGLLAPCFDIKNSESHLLPFIGQYITGQSDISTGCPFAMTHPVAVLIAKYAPKEIKAKYLPEIIRTDGYTPVGGTWATEKHSGSNVGGTITEFKRLDKVSNKVQLSGHNWFTSAIGFDRWLTVKTARHEKAAEGSKGLSLILVPSHLDESWENQESLKIQNSYDITHLKDKIGTRALPTGEITLEKTIGYEIAGEGEGLKAMMSSLGCSRVHNAMSAAGVMRRAYLESLSWAANRLPFNAPLIEEPDIQRRCLEICAQWMAGSALAFESARSYADNAQGTGDIKWTRIITALAKYKTAEQAIWCTRKALELTGGNGYTNEYPVARQWLDSEVLNVWEGPEQIQAFELVRMLSDRQSADILRDKLNSIESALDGRKFKEPRANISRLSKELFSELDNLFKGSSHKLKGISGDLLDNLSTIFAYALLCHEAKWESENKKDNTKLEICKEFYRLHNMDHPVKLDLKTSPAQTRMETELKKKKESHFPGTDL